MQEVACRVTIIHLSQFNVLIISILTRCITCIINLKQSILVIESIIVDITLNY